jgi:hypothetical protein
MDAPLSDDDDDEMKRDRERAIKRPAWLHETSRYSVCFSFFQVI